MLPSDLDLQRVPIHIACVMDGNGRWAEQRGLPRTEGHTAGESSLFDVLEGADNLGVSWFTVYAFSTENWRRPAEEVQFLLGFNEQILVNRRDEMHERNMRVRFIGRRDRRTPRRLVRLMDEAEELTRDNSGLTFTVAFNYGGRAELVDAFQQLVDSGVKRVTEKAIARNLYDPEMPSPDLVIRTSGEYRVSNFLLWQIAYSELVFSETLWPDFRREHLYSAIKEFQDRDRRFGGVGEL
ncbi:MAG: polyprenyl diphosphate synthase [Acidimicrobiales bacterium]|nr:di-trans,poly-cis-decaprenylcistransferase [Acidimicrobiaceae bacterium]MDP6077330.1 polyprenyl diphosphate synthase [Acidimicrobiales bacterium]HCV36340.1 di-trans,poly-cis-decaprenylcistransferase [Acidimicrobiaceae bacterium]HJO80589.1 polyprenyl diphosphate synthase [Acidimicrobiales bacterium]